MAHLSVQRAQSVVNDIQVTNGGFTPEVQKALPKEALKAFRNLQSIAGGSIVHVAEDLYDTDARFIFELIPNAEDSSFDRASRLGEKAFLHFTLHEDHITVDSNEDDFSKKDVRAICSLNRSTKIKTGGYISHKGIGFKSVLKVAFKVHIQSGPFSFYLEHRQGDTGLGMITPFHKSVKIFRMVRINGLDEIPDTLLLFLRKLEKLTVVNLPLKSKVTYNHHEDTTKCLVTLTKETDEYEQKKSYYLAKTTVELLPAHHSRPGQEQADLILAFPVEIEFNPFIEAQYVYSFIPMRREGFNEERQIFTPESYSFCPSLN